MRLVCNTQRRLAPWLITLVLPLVAAFPLKAQQLEVLINEGVQNWGLAVDRSSNVFVARSLQGTETLGAGQSGATSLTSVGGVDLSIAKYDASGQLLWARAAGGPGTDVVEIIETDAEGNVYLAGTWAGAQNTAITFGAGTAGAVSLTSTKSSSEDVFLASYTPDGTLRWVRSIVSEDPDFVYDLDVAGNRIVVVGNVGDNVSTYDGGTVAPVTIDISSSRFFSFVAVYTTAGDLEIVRGAESTQRVVIRAGAIDPAGNVIAAGTSLRNIYVSGTEYTFPVVTSREAFLVKWSPAGDVAWVKHTATASGVRDTRPYRMTTNAGGDIFVTGGFSGPFAFWSDSPQPASLTPAGNFDVFLAGFGPDGTPLWARSAGGTGEDYGFRITADGGGDLVVSGIFSGTATFGAGEANAATATSTGQADLFTAIYEANGSLRWFSHSSGSAVNDHPDGLEVTPSGDILVGTQFGNRTVLANGTAIDIGFGTRALVLKYTNTSLVSRDLEGELPDGFALGQNYPNPFNPSTTIRYTLPASIAPGARVRLSVHDLLGREVAVLLDGTAAVGSHELTWMAAGLPSGVYISRLQAGAEQTTRRLVLQK